ncbi:MAG TPA: phage major capsid protein, partial [Phycisphaerae bacterium]|nr:phage major capsid protein [Phycisphaerae bacterium]
MAEQMTGEKALETIAQHTEALTHTVTKAELKEQAEKWKADFEAANEKIREMTRQPLFTGAANRFADVHIPAKYHGDRERMHEHVNSIAPSKGSDLERYQILSDGLALYGNRATTKRKRERLMAGSAYTEWKEMHDQIMGKYSMDTTSESEWFASQTMSGSLIDRIRDAASIAALFMRFPMASKAVVMPVLGGDGTVYYIAEATTAPDDSSAASIIPNSQLTSAQVALTAVKLALRIVQTTELPEEVTFDDVNWLAGQAAETIARNIDDVLINGDTAGTHMDADVTGASHRFKSMHGLRSYAIDNSYTTA